MFAKYKGSTFAALLLLVAIPQAAAQRPETQPRATAGLDINASVQPNRPDSVPSSLSSFFIPRQLPVTPETFFDRFGQRLGLGRDDRMVEFSRGQSVSTGRESIRFQQYHRGVKVLGAGYRLVLEGNRVMWGSGQLATGISPDMARQVSQDEALRRARKAMTFSMLPAINGLTWPDQDFHEMLLVPVETAGPNTDYQLVHSFILRPANTLLSYRVYVHAQSGGIVLLRSEAQEAWVPATGSGNTTYDGSVGPFPVELDVPTTTHRLQSPGVITLSMANANPGTWNVLEPQMASATDIESDSSVFTDPLHANGVSAHFGSVAALELFRSGLGIPLANAPQITNYVDVPLTEGFALNLYWLNKSMFGTTGCPIVALD
ncbi:MAG: hypothetical protein HKN15_13085, partial [Xanthomonadales bacterium]|nr:hypothetical protein [Xanthomonadales bacterium]